MARLIKVILGVFLAGGLSLGLLGGGLLLYSLEAMPLIKPPPALTSEDMKRAKAILHRYDPRYLPVGARQTIRLAQADINQVSNYALRWLLPRDWPTGDAAADVQLGEQSLLLRATWALPLPMDRHYINLQLRVATEDGEHRLKRLQMGALEFEGEGLHRLARGVESLLLATHSCRLLRTFIRDVEMAPEQLRVTYEWHPELIPELRAELLVPAEEPALAAYYRALSRIPQDQGITFTQALSGMFRLAAQRGSRGDPVAENRAMLLVLGAWAGERGMHTLLPESRLQSLPRAPAFHLTLHDRKDLAQHFLVSAALAAGGDEELAELVGLYKELADGQQGGSGFSFSDLAADRAGGRFGNLAVSSEDAALALTTRMAGEGVSDTDVMPAVEGLPEPLSGNLLAQRYGGVGDAGFEALRAEIGRRVDACDLYRSGWNGRLAADRGTEN